MEADQPPDFIIYDIESARLLQKGKDPAAGGVAVIAGWGVRSMAPLVWLLDSSRLPRIILTEAHIAKEFAKYSGVVTWNGVSFDDLVLKKCIPDLRKTYAKKRHVDLHALCCLLAAGVDASRLIHPLEPNWAGMVPTLRADLVNSGWSLEAVARGTLGVGKTEGPQGAEAVTAWNAGRYSEVASYCIGDVALTRELFLYAWKHGFLISEERGRVSIPREVMQ